MKSSKAVKKIIAKQMSGYDIHHGRVSVRLGESDSNMDRIEINFVGSVSLNPIQNILKKENFYVAQIVDFYYPKKQTILLIRYKKRK